MFTHVVVEPTEESPHELECAFTHCDCTMPFGDVRVFTWLQPKQRMYAAFCSYRCALKAMNPEAMWRA